MAKRGDALWRGIQRHGAGWRATVSQGRGRAPVQKHFPKDTDPRVMQDWRKDAKAEHHVKRKQRATSGTFEYDAKRYLKAVKGLTTYAEREADIQRWIAIFKATPRERITSVDIREWRDKWMIEPRSKHGWKGQKDKADQPYAASTINHWLRALSNMWTVLDGRRAPNPVRDVPEVAEPDPLPRAQSYETIEKILDAMDDRGRPKDGKRPTVSLTKIRLRIIAYTGLTYAQLRDLTREDVDLAAGTMLVRRRRKGKGAKPRLLGLVPQAIDAFKALDEADAWGHDFSGSSVHSSFTRAARKVLGPKTTVRPYDLRHSFGSAIYRATKSREAVQALLSHGTLAMSERYTLAVADEVLAQQLASASSQIVKPASK